jgi:hypothetical protein
MKVEMENNIYDPNRQTGRTTGLMLQALGNAALARGVEVEFIDHWPHTYSSAIRMGLQLRNMSKALGLLMDVRSTE